MTTWIHGRLTMYENAEWRWTALGGPEWPFDGTPQNGQQAMTQLGQKGYQLVTIHPGVRCAEFWFKAQGISTSTHR